MIYAINEKRLKIYYSSESSWNKHSNDTNSGKSDSGLWFGAYKKDGSDEYTEHDEKIYAREIQRLKLGLDAARAKAPDRRILVALHYPPSDPSGRVTGFTEILEEYGVWKCIYGHLHGQVAFGRGIRGEVRGVQYQLVSLDYLGAKPKLIYDDEGSSQ